MSTAAFLSSASSVMTRSPLLTCSPCLTGSSVDDAHDARRQRRALVGLRLAGNADRARMVHVRRRHHGDGAQRRLGLGFSRLGLARVRRLGLLGFSRLGFVRRDACRQTRIRLSPSRRAKRDEHDNGCKLVKPDFRHLVFQCAGFWHSAASSITRARRRYGCAQGRVQIAVIGEARFYIKVAPQYSQKS